MHGTWYIVFVIPSFKSKALPSSQDLLLWEFACFNIVSCQSFNRLPELPKPSSTRLTTCTLSSALPLVNQFLLSPHAFEPFLWTSCQDSWIMILALFFWGAGGGVANKRSLLQGIPALFSSLAIGSIIQSSLRAAWANFNFEGTLISWLTVEINVKSDVSIWSYNSIASVVLDECNNV